MNLPANAWCDGGFAYIKTSHYYSARGLQTELLCSDTESLEGFRSHTTTEAFILESLQRNVPNVGERSHFVREAVPDTVLDGLECLFQRPVIEPGFRIPHLLGTTNGGEERGFFREGLEGEWFAVVVFPDVTTLDEFHRVGRSTRLPAVGVTHLVGVAERTILVAFVQLMIADALDDELDVAVVTVNEYLVLLPEGSRGQVAEADVRFLEHAALVTLQSTAPLLFGLVGHRDAVVARNEATVGQKDSCAALRVIDARGMHEDAGATVVYDGVVDAADHAFRAVGHVVVGVRPAAGFGVDLEDDLVTDFQKFVESHYISSVFEL